MKMAAFFRRGPFSPLAVFIFLSLSLVSAQPPYWSTKDPQKLILGGQNLMTWRNEMSELARVPEPSNNFTHSTLVLAGSRTNRPDILRGFRHYRGGWDISNSHYWASVGFTGAACFILAVLWFFAFGLVLLIYFLCGWRIDIKDKGSKNSETICLVILIIFTSAAVTGCIILSVGESQFHRESLRTLHYVVNKSDYTVQTLRNVTEHLALAKTINVAQIVLPSDIMDDIDQLDVDLNTDADTLDDETEENSDQINKVFTIVHSALVAVAVVMLLLVLTGLCLSILGCQHAIIPFVICGWLLVAITFVLCGFSVILNNAISDTCVAMGEWVENPHSETALSNILPCVDQTTTNKTLVQSKNVINNIVSIVDQFIYTIGNANSNVGNPYFYNQSGPTMPALCFPYDNQLHERQCTALEVTFANASTVWKKYECLVSANGFCTTVGRLTPEIYSQLVAAVNESYALDYYTPLLLNVQNCGFVRDTFQAITTSYCPSLEHFLRIVNAGLALMSVACLLCLVLWLLYANRPLREDEFAKLSFLTKLNRSGCSNKNDSAKKNGD